MSTAFQPTRLVGAIAIAMGFSSPAFAQDQSSDKTATLDTIVVTASKTPESIKNVPARINIIEPKILEQSPIASLPQLLETDASINMVQSGGYGQTASIFLRGGNSNQTLVLRDGVRLNSATSGTASLPFIDTTDIKQIEVLKGPASVLYGTDAISGVVQLISKTPETTSAFVTGEIGENKTYKSVIGADLAENGFYAQIRGQRLETDGTPVKDVINAPNASFDQKGYSAKVGVDKERYAASVDYSENQGSSDYDNFGRLVSQDFKNEIINVKGRLNILENLAVHARFSQFKDEIDQNNSTDFVHSKTQEAEIYGQWGFTPNQQILVGVTHRNIDGDVLSYGSPYQEDIDSTGYYIQHKYDQAGLNTQVGVRVEDNEKFGTHTVAQGSVRYQVLPLTSIYANIGSAFKAPTLNDMYAYGGNPNLKPEESLSYEIGLDQKLAYNISTGLSLYTTEVDNLIDFDGVLNQMRNLEKAKMEGSELYVKWQGENLFTNLSYNYVRAKNKKNDEDLSRRPRQNIALTAGWTDEQYTFSTTMLANGDYDNSTFDNVQIPGHFRVDMHGQYKVNKNVDVFANIQNVGDSKYRTAYGSGSYYINGGRLASAGVTFRY
ncbi:TonB-dependent receptor plug domain-containing protein [Acinetobacter colistiniresistens]|uniref:Iron complex outermembrane recepter protein n=1 Tax=Acinetobacter colistiniresistens TaxID=280145 RepID=S3SZH7_9GAMM|nr:TonB-dependent receptor [Acinetobacter colistiniresistens]EPG34661.1 iron complex outermembrane recepter protein [Acinetobacter colistiniresistens]TVT84496.1 TonB-dependent receptor [Acinetobacter colistiniresistens]